MGTHRHMDRTVIYSLDARTAGHTSTLTASLNSGPGLAIFVGLSMAYPLRPSLGTLTLNRVPR